MVCLYGWSGREVYLSWVWGAASEAVDDECGEGAACGGGKASWGQAVCAGGEEGSIGTGAFCHLHLYGVQADAGGGGGMSAEAQGELREGVRILALVGTAATGWLAVGIGLNAMQPSEVRSVFGFLYLLATVALCAMAVSVLEVR